MVVSEKVNLEESGDTKPRVQKRRDSRAAEETVTTFMTGGCFRVKETNFGGVNE